MYKNNLKEIKKNTVFIIPIVLCLGTIFSSIMKPEQVSAQVNVATSFSVTTGSTTAEGYKPGQTIDIETDAISDDAYFQQFDYDLSLITSHGTWYSSNDGKFHFTFIMPNCDVTITPEYGDCWTVNTNEGIKTYTSVSELQNIISGYSYYYADYTDSDIDVSGYSQKIYTPGNLSLATYEDATGYSITIDGENYGKFVEGQTVVIDQKYIDDNDDYQLLSGYSEIEDPDQYVYLSSDGTKHLQTKFTMPGNSLDLNSKYEQGYNIQLDEENGNSLASTIAATGDTVSFAVPTNQEGQTVTMISATDSTGNNLKVSSSIKGNNTIYSTIVGSDDGAIIVRWGSAEETEEENNTKISNSTLLKTTMTKAVKEATYKLSTINSKGTLEIADNTGVVKIRIASSDIKKNRDNIISIQKQLSSDGDDYRDGIYIIHLDNETITNYLGEEETLTGYFFQKGSATPHANDTWQQVG